MLNTIKTSKPFMTFITHPLHQNIEIYIFHKKTYTFFTMSNFLSFQKTIKKIISILYISSSHIFYSIKDYRPFMTFGTFSKHLSICINIFCKKILTTLFLCNTVCYVNRLICNMLFLIMSLYQNRFFV